MFRPCAPMGGTTWAASAIRAVRGPVKRSAIWLMIGHSVSRVACVRWPQHPGRAAFSAASKASGAGRIRRATSGPRSIQTTAEDGFAVAVGQRHQRERPARAVDLGRDIVMRAFMGDGEGQRLLAVARVFTPMPSASRTDGIAAIGADTSRARMRAAVGQGDQRLAPRARQAGGGGAGQEGDILQSRPAGPKFRGAAASWAGSSQRAGPKFRRRRSRASAGPAASPPASMMRMICKGVAWGAAVPQARAPRAPRSRDAERPCCAGPSPRRRFLGHRGGGIDADHR
jgi:hypothetical protein